MQSRLAESSHAVIGCLRWWMGVGAVYPFQGTEVLMVIVGVVLWIGWHIWQMRAEAAEYKADIASFGSPDAIKKALDKNP